MHAHDFHIAQHNKLEALTQQFKKTYIYWCSLYSDASTEKNLKVEWSILLFPAAGFLPAAF